MKLQDLPGGEFGPLIWGAVCHLHKLSVGQQACHILQIAEAVTEMCSLTLSLTLLSLYQALA